MPDALPLPADSDTLTDTLLGSRDAVGAVRAGLRHESVETVRKALVGDSDGLTVNAHGRHIMEVVAANMASMLNVSEKTLSRRRGGRLSASESDRLLLVAETYDLAVRALDSADRARDWLARPHALLGGEPPLQRLDTIAGAREVQAMLYSIEYGMAA